MDNPALQLMVRPWSEIREFYARQGHAKDFSKLAPMLELVRAIEASHYAIGLYAWTSHWDLFIVQTPVEYPYHGPRLRISLLGENQLEFRYIDTPYKEKQWSRTVDGMDGFRRLESFIQQLHWFERV